MNSGRQPPRSAVVGIAADRPAAAFVQVEPDCVPGVHVRVSDVVLGDVIDQGVGGTGAVDGDQIFLRCLGGICAIAAVSMAMWSAAGARARVREYVWEQVVARHGRIPPRRVAGTDLGD